MAANSLLKGNAKDNLRRFWKQILALLVTVGTIVPFLFLLSSTFGLSVFERVVFSLVVLLVLANVSVLILLVSYVRSDDRFLITAGHGFLWFEEVLRDERNHFREVEKVWDIREAGQDIKLIKRLHGYNTSTEPVTSIYTGAQAVDVIGEDLVRAYELDTVDRGPVTWSPISPRRRLADIDSRLGSRTDWSELDVSLHEGGKFQGIYEIELRDEKRHQEEFAVEIESSHGSKELEECNFFHFAFLEFEREVDTATCKLLLDTAPDRIEARKFTNSGDTSFHADPAKLDLDVRTCDIEDESDETADIVEYELIDSTPGRAIFVCKLVWE